MTTTAHKLAEALEKIAAMDPGAMRADDLGRAADVARSALALFRSEQAAERVESDWMDEELADVDKLLLHLGFDPEQARTDGGRLRVNWIIDVLASGALDSQPESASQGAEGAVIVDSQRYSPDGEGGMEIDSLGAWVRFSPQPPQQVRLPQFDAMNPDQERLAREFCEEIAGPLGEPGSPPDPVRLLEMAQALYLAEVGITLAEGEKTA